MQQMWQRKLGRKQRGRPSQQGGLHVAEAEGDGVSVLVEVRVGDKEGV